MRLDPKRAGEASASNPSGPSDVFEERSWGQIFKRYNSLQKLKFELETVSYKKTQLDNLVGRAEEWVFLCPKKRAF